MVTNLLFLILFLLNPFISDSKNPASATNEETGILWTNSRRLTWDDFKSPADEKESLHAMTSTNIAVKANCIGNQMRFEVKCVFVTKDSWTKNRMSHKLLAHEQMHFDLTEVHARLLRQKLNETAAVCGNSRLKLDPIVEKHFAAWKSEQDQYDEETNHGLLEEKQKVWEEKIANRLAQLESFSYRTYALK
ncbi:hypothetical protein AAE02nite_34760 [Adhaeribacter aerolatus]|uniref:DUF922 domain-containing protein n=1 Tax=Adhaeribacter aerolatus TaxID=670289 RepID=A0A512B1I1_9BACT|nr:DUF922 domain-containing protein [Adhaeribacter aerolatus]GEO05812.1 hypothetical protein AAE02nite_34760 [Adhaeribacter aerolatus]